MLADLLHPLAEDVRRLLRAGGLAAAHDEGLRRRLEALRPLAERVPALAALAAAVERVATAGEEKAAAALLDLLVLLRPVRAALAKAGAEGELANVPACGPWATPVAAADLYALYKLDKDGYRLDETQCGALQEASERGRAADLRHVGPFLDLLARGYGPMAELLFREVLPFYGRALLPDLWALMHRHPCLLLAAYHLDRDAALAAVPTLLPMLSDEERRLEVVRTLGRVGAAEAVPYLVGMLEDDRWRPEAMEALGRIGPAAREAIAALRRFVNRWGERELQFQAMEALRGITRHEEGGRG